MTLGAILARLDDEAFVEETLAGIGDLVLVARLRSAAAEAEEPLGSFVSAVVGHYVQHADGERWLALMTAAGKASDPAAACLHRMLLDAMADERQEQAAPHRH